MMALRGWCTSPPPKAHPPFQSRQAQLERGVRGKRACSVWSGGKAAKPYLSLPYGVMPGGQSARERPDCICRCS
jgi:hypothetical protein